MDNLSVYMSKKVFFYVFFASLLLTFCKEVKKENSPDLLTFYLAESIPVPEPSGLDLSADEKSFWIVSDQNSTVYLMNGWGKVIKNFKVNGEDLEGITVIDDKTLAVVLERTREVVVIDTSGKEINRAKVKLEGELNSGLEGITYDPAQKKFYILNEKNPRLLITLDDSLNELNRDTLNYSKDVSGIYFDPNDKALWILSDESQRVFKTDLSGKPIEEFRIKVAQPEGITFNKSHTKMYLVSDRTENLYVFNLE
jgi:uncharacterized protein YjiK